MQDNEIPPCCCDAGRWNYTLSQAVLDTLSPFMLSHFAGYKPKRLLKTCTTSNRLIAAEVPYLLVVSSLQTQIREVKVIRATRVYFWRTLTSVLLFKPWGDWKGFRQSCHRICCMLCLPWDMETKLVSTLIPSDSSAASHISSSIHVEDPSLLEFSVNLTDKYNVTNKRRVLAGYMTLKAPRSFRMSVASSQSTQTTQRVCNWYLTRQSAARTIAYIAEVTGDFGRQQHCCQNLLCHTLHTDRFRRFCKIANSDLALSCLVCPSLRME